MGTTSKCFGVGLLIRWGPVLGDGAASGSIFQALERQVQVRQRGAQSSQALDLHRWGTEDVILEPGVLVYVRLGYCLSFELICPNPVLRGEP